MAWHRIGLVAIVRDVAGLGAEACNDCSCMFNHPACASAAATEISLDAERPDSNSTPQRTRKKGGYRKPKPTGAALGMRGLADYFPGQIGSPVPDQSCGRKAAADEAGSAGRTVVVAVGGVVDGVVARAHDGLHLRTRDDTRNRWFN